ncbi:MAG: RNA-directed DNA polymerase [Planctomycetes bacterium]|nr:RNA-directed DNA polymerase [Planctomycetota bacterium]
MGILDWLARLLRGGGESPFAAGRKGPRLGLKLNRLWHLARNVEGHYSEFDLEMPGGRKRRIEAPDGKLRWVQRKILRNVLDRQEQGPCCHGFRKKHSIATNAAGHVGKEMVLAVDIEDFFPSITFPRVYGLFKSMGFDRGRSALLAKLTTRNGTLPQGAPTSPAIANLLCRRLDRRLGGLAAKARMTYTRYADDLTFSGSADAAKYLRLIVEIVKEEGFALNPAKTRMMRRNRRQEVTGLVVNDKVGLPREWKRNLRAALHHLRTGRPASDGPEKIHGKLAFLKMVHPEQYVRELAALKALS